MEFITKAREDGKAIIYIGFGSIVVPDSTAVTKAVVNAVLVRRPQHPQWFPRSPRIQTRTRTYERSSRRGGATAARRARKRSFSRPLSSPSLQSRMTGEPLLVSSYGGQRLKFSTVRLFPLIDAACHHGGAGTVGASLRGQLRFPSERAHELTRHHLQRACRP